MAEAQDWPKAIRKHLRFGGKVFSIWGGFQVLGTEVQDPDGLDVDAGSTDGLGLLRMTLAWSSENN